MARGSLVSAVTAGAHLSDVRVQCMQAVLPYTTGYIWQDGVFSLQSSTDADPPWIQTAGVRKANTSVSAASDHHVLWGTTSFGDNVEDEWFIVWLLLHLTRQVSLLSTCICALAL